MTPIYLSDWTWPDVEAYLTLDNRLIFVTGATEQHGRHLPLATDSIIPTTLAERLSARTGVPIAPVFHYGMSEAHMAFPGTLTLSQDVLQGAYLDLIKSAYRHGWRRLFVLNGHGGNRAAWNWAASLACKIKQDLKIYMTHWWTEESVRDLSQEVYGRAEGHAGLEETAAVLVSHAHLVHLNDAVGTENAPDDIWTQEPHIVRAALPTGAIGAAPGDATTEHGERIIAILVEDYGQLLEGEWA